jgi:predicted HTH transcriptional regulator
MTEACREAGLEPPKLEEIGMHFRVTIFTTRTARPVMDELDRKIVGILSRCGAISTAIMARQIRISPRATSTRLRALVARGILVEIGTGPNDPKRQYALAK